MAAGQQLAALFIFVEEFNDFVNDGFGWICRHCARELREPADRSKHSRLMREGEAEGKNPSLSTQALARWVDKTHRALTCPRCGITESIEKL
jgi:hypothetical protein